MKNYYKLIRDNFGFMSGFFQVGEN